MPRRIQYPPKPKVNEKGTVLRHPHDKVEGRPREGATLREQEAEILSRHQSPPGRQPTPKR
jgi:hypothetical protein